MTRQVATLMIESPGRLDGSAPVIEECLMRTPGVLRAFVNPVVEAVYVEYDADQFQGSDLVNDMESQGVRATLVPLHRWSPRGIPS